MASDRTQGTAALLRPLPERSAIDAFIVMDVMRQAAAAEAAGRDIVHMEVGQPATAAPKAAREAVKRALDADNLGYTLALGLDPLRERIARLYRDWYGIDLSPERVVVTSGSSGAFVLAFLSLFGIGDRVALPAPGYPCYRHILTALGARPVNIETGPATRWMPTAAQIEAAAEAEDLAGLLIASPANPTGTMLEPDRLAEIAAVARRRKLWFVSDEIYHGLTWGLPQATALQFSDDVVVINSFSKYFSMTGWRVGWMVVPPGLVRTVERLAQNLYISPPAVSQVAALGAFDGMDELEANRRVYAANRDLLLARAAQGRALRDRAGGWRLLSLCRRLALHRRQPRLHEADAGRGRRRGDAGRRFRRGARAAVRALFLRGFHRAHGRGGATPAGVGAAARVTASSETPGDTCSHRGLSSPDQSSTRETPS